MNTIRALYLLEGILEYLSKYDLIHGELYRGLFLTAHQKSVSGTISW